MMRKLFLFGALALALTFVGAIVWSAGVFLFTGQEASEGGAIFFGVMLAIIMLVRYMKFAK